MAYPFDLKNINLNINYENLDEVLDDEIIDANIFSNSEFISKGILSSPYISYDVGEVKNLSAEFQYNYFVLDENFADIQNTQSIVGYNTADLSYESNNKKIGKIPRFVRLTFQKPQNFQSVSIQELSKIKLTEENITFEGASSSKMYTGLEISDIDMKDYVYDNLMINYDFQRPDVAVQRGDNNRMMTTTDYSTNEIARIIGENLAQDQNFFGESKKLLIKSILNSKTQGVIVSGNDFTPEETEKAKNIISKKDITFSLKINNFFMNDIITRAGRFPVHTFADELKNAESIAKEITAETLMAINANEITEEELSESITGLETLSDNDLTEDDINNYDVKIAGYFIKKYEINPNGTVVEFKNQIIPGNSLTFIDTNIKYGGLYVYKIHVIFQVTSAIQIISADNQNEYKYCKFLIASEGRTTNVKCNEFISPPPPDIIRARYDYKTQFPRISWQFPLNTQRDIVGFQIFRRLSINEPFTLCAEYDFNPLHNAPSKPETAQSKNYYKMPIPKLYYLDTKYEYGTKPIYCIASVDAHGMTSNLGTQIMFEYNKFINKTKVSLISRSNAPKPYPNVYLEKDTFLDAIKVSNYKKMTVFFDPEYYRVFKNNSQGLKDTEKIEKDIAFLSVNNEKPTYNIHIINLDSQKDKIIKIKISDEHQTLLDKERINQNDI